jgi:hypothetical protein
MSVLVHKLCKFYGNCFCFVILLSFCNVYVTLYIKAKLFFMAYFKLKQRTC